MSQPGLTDRLNQHSQRTGPLIGCGMGLAMVVCVVTGTFLYVRLDEYRTDLFGVPTVVQSVPTLPPVPTVRLTRTVVPGADKPVADKPAESAPPPPPPAPTPVPASPVKYRIARTGNENLNMRAQASNQASIVARLPPGTVVEALGEQATVQNAVWRQVRTASGQVGWVLDQYLDRVEG